MYTQGIIETTEEKMNGNNYIPPDYSLEDPAESESPREEELAYDSDLDDEDWEDDEDMSDLEENTDPDDEEQITDRQEALNKKLEEMGTPSYMNSPFTPTPPSTPQFGTPIGQQYDPYGNQQSQQQSPWEQQQQAQQQNNGYSTFGGGSSQGGWNYGSSQQTQQPQQELPKIARPKKIVLCDVLDILVESWGSQGRPNVLPRGIFDIKLKFDVWDKIASFTPEQVIILFPSMSGGMIDRQSWKVALKWIAYSLASYIRLQPYNCNIIIDSVHGRPKQEFLKEVVEKLGQDRRDMVYIGVYSGFWNLGNGDRLAADLCGIDYADVWQLLRGQI